MFTANKDIMGEFVNARVTTLLGWAIALLIIGFNVYLLLVTFGLMKQ